MVSPAFTRLGRIYNAVAQMLLATVVVFVLVNVALYLVPSLRATTAVDTPMGTFGLDRLMPAYPGWSREEVLRLHDESRVVFEYKPIVEFRIKPIKGEYVNESPVGYRANAHQAPWPPNRDAINIFVFGGSTTFGWLLPDRETIVSQLQDQLLTSCDRPVAVYNFGQPSYISTQEALFFQSLVLDGVAPQVAIFIDGLNEFNFRGQMSYTGALSDMMAGTDVRQRLGLLTQLPLYLFAQKVNARFFFRPSNLEPAAEAQLFDQIIEQWLRNQRLIESTSQQHGIKPIFVWQPVPSYRYDLSKHFLYQEGKTPYADLGRAYTRMAERRQSLEARGNLLWLADMQSDANENLYVDRIHYNSKFSGEIASRIKTFLEEGNRLGCPRAQQ